MEDVFDWRVPLRDIGAQGLSGAFSANAEQRIELARVVDIKSCDSLTFSYDIKPLRSGMYRLSGRIAADIAQACVVTLEPITGRIDESIDTELRPADLMSEDGPTGEDMTVLDRPDFEPIEGDEINIGRIVQEHFSTVIDPYPRLPGEELDVHAAGDAEAANPFAILKNLKK